MAGGRKVVLHILGDEKDLVRALKRSTVATKQFQASTSKIGKQIGQTNRALVQGAAGGSAFARGMGLASASMLGVGGLVFGLTESVKTAAQFELTMQRTVGLSGIAQSAIAGLTKEVIALAPVVGRGPQELAEALYFITSSGVPAARAMEVLDAAAKGSASGLGETQVVADAVTSVLNAYGASAGTAADVTDTLTATVREGKGEAADFAGVIGNVVALGSQLGVTFNDVGAALAAMTRLGTDAETAATQLQQVFSNLTKVTPQQAKAFQSVGLTAAGLREQLGKEGLLSVLKTIKTAFAENIPAMARAFGDIRALRGVLALVGNQADSVNKIFERMANSGGSAAKAFGAVADTPAQKFARFGAAIEAVKIAIGVGLAPALSEAAVSMTKWLANTDNQKALTDALKDTAEALKDLVGFGKDVVGALGGVKETFKLLLIAFAGAKLMKYAGQLRAIGAAGFFAAKGQRAAALAVPLLGYELSKLIRENVPGWEKFWRDGGKQWYDWGRSATNALGLTQTDADLVTEALHRIQFAAGEAHLALERAMRAQERVTLGAGPGMSLIRTKPGDSGGPPPPKPPKGATAEQRNAWFDAAIGRKGDRVQDIATLNGQLAELKTIEGQLRARLAITTDITRRQKLEDDILKNARDQASVRQGLADEFAAGLQLNLDRAGLTKGLGDDLAALNAIAANLQKQIAAGKNVAANQSALVGVMGQIAGIGQQAAADLLDNIQLKIDKALLTSGLADDLAAWEEMEAGIRAQIAASGRTNELERQLLASQGEQAKIRQRRRNASQFRSFGLSATGGELVPNKESLLKTVTAQLTAITGTVEDTAKNRKFLTAFRALLVNPLTKVSEEVRSAMDGILDTIKDGLDDIKRPLTTTTGLDSKKLVAGLGLSPEQVRELRGRVSGVNSAGRQLAPVGAGADSRPIIVENHNTITLDGWMLGKNITRSQQQKRRRNPAQRRGPNRGGF